MTISPFGDVFDAISSIADSDWTSTFGTLAAIGAISMTLVQLFKELTPIRTKWQKHWFTEWLQKYEKDPNSTKNPFMENYKCEDPPSLIDELADVAAGGESKYLYEQSGDDLTKSVLRAAPIIIDEPDRYPRLITRLVWGLAEADMGVLAQGPIAPKDPNLYLDARARALRRIERNLEGASLLLTSKWRFITQTAAIAATTIVVLLSVGLTGRMSVATLLASVPIALVGGYFAPITKDLLATIQAFAARVR
jgi:hypothetical protein